MSSQMALLATTTEGLTRWDRAAGVTAFGCAVLVVRLPFRYVVRMVTAVTRLCPQPATLGEAAKAVTAVKGAGRWFPGRAACLESSLAAVVASALHGRSLRWCIGARLMPYATHSWVEACGQAIGEPDNADRPYLLQVRI